MQLRRRVELLEAVDEVERLGVEQRELLLDREREVGAGLERRAGGCQHVLPGAALFLSHRPGSVPLQESLGRRRARASRAATPAHDQRRSTARRAELRSSSWSAARQREDRLELAAQVGGVAALERDEVPEPLG